MYLRNAIRASSVKRFVLGLTLLGTCLEMLASLPDGFVSDAHAQERRAQDAKADTVVRAREQGDTPGDRQGDKQGDTPLTPEELSASRPANQGTDTSAPSPKGAGAPKASKSTGSILDRTSAPTPTLTERTTSGLAYGVLFLAVLAGGWKRWAQKKGLTNRDNQIELIARRGISQKTALLIVRVDGRRFLLSQGAEQLTLLSELEEPVEESQLETPTIDRGMDHAGRMHQSFVELTPEEFEYLRRVHGE